VIVGRLAPTPSGRLHLGNTCAAAAAWLSVRSQRGKLLLRVEDVDTTRSRPELEAGLIADLGWLGLDWDERVPNQSTRDYRPWISLLPTYLCDCTRKTHGRCRCRDASRDDGAVRFLVPDGVVRFTDRKFGLQHEDPRGFDDPVLRRRDGCATYSLAVVADDIADGVTEVVRGADLLGFTAVQVRLWEAFGATPPTWLHAPLILGDDGRKLSKSHGSLGIAALRDAGYTPHDVWRRVLPWLGLDGYEHVHDAVEAFRADFGPLGPLVATPP
jgi:glutamyl-tRNA synthetase